MWRTKLRAASMAEIAGFFRFLGARKRATGRRRGGEIWGIQCARPREERGAEKAALTGSTRSERRRRARLSGEEGRGETMALGHLMAI